MTCRRISPVRSPAEPIRTNQGFAHSGDTLIGWKGKKNHRIFCHASHMQNSDFSSFLTSQVSINQPHHFLKNRTPSEPLGWLFRPWQFFGRQIRLPSKWAQRVCCPELFLWCQVFGIWWYDIGISWSSVKRRQAIALSSKICVSHNP